MLRVQLNWSNISLFPPVVSVSLLSHATGVVVLVVKCFGLLRGFSSSLLIAGDVNRLLLHSTGHIQLLEG